jgi:hypothetical protein
MPRDGATTFGDLVDRLEALRVGCENCGRAFVGRWERSHANSNRNFVALRGIEPHYVNHRAAP